MESSSGVGLGSGSSSCNGEPGENHTLATTQHAESVAPAEDADVPLAIAVVAEDTAAVHAAQSATTAHAENAMLRRALEEQHAKLVAQAEALKSLGATPDSVPVMSMPVPVLVALPSVKKRGRPIGSKNKPKAPKADGLSSSDVPEDQPLLEPLPKAKRGRPLGSKNKPKQPKEGAVGNALVVVAEPVIEPHPVEMEASVVESSIVQEPAKPKRGRPLGSKNKPKLQQDVGISSGAMAASSSTVPVSLTVQAELVREDDKGVAVPSIPEDSASAPAIAA